MPFGSHCEFEDFAACVAEHQDKDDPKAYCAVLMQHTEEHCKAAMATSRYVSRDDFGKRAIALDGKMPGDSVLLRKQFVCEDISKIGKQDGVDSTRQRRFTISTGTVDRDNDTIASDGWQLDNYRKNPVVLFAHDYNSLPIARAVKIGVEKGNLVAVAEFASHPMADTCLSLIDGGFLRATSVGFRPMKVMKADRSDGFDFKEQELLEFSIVPVPANPEALMQAEAGGIDLGLVKSWALSVMKATGQDSPAATMCTACGFPMDDKGSCTGCGWRAPSATELTDAMRVEGPAAASVDDPIRWNTALSKAFDVDEEPLEASRLEYTWASRFLGVPVKDIYETTVHIPSPRMGAYLSALEEAVAQYKTEATRRMTHNGREEPPVYDTIQLNSKLTRSFLVDGIRFLSGSAKMVARIEPSWCGVSLTMYAQAAAAEHALEFLTDIATRATQYKFMRGEAFALSGEFLTRGSESWDDLFLAKVNTDPLARTVALINEHGAQMETRGIIMAGPPGTGKTLAGRVMMNQAKDATYIWVSSRDFYRSGAAGGISLAYDLAAENAPSIVFIEDIDSWLDNSSIDLLKTELDGLKQRKGIVTVLTTNFPEQLPEALVDRPGRFHDVLMLSLPTETIRRAMLAKWAPDAKANTLDTLAKDTQAFSGAHLRELVRFAETIRAQDGLKVDAALVQALEKVRAQRTLIDETRRQPRVLRTVKMFAMKGAAPQPEWTPDDAVIIVAKDGPGEEDAELVGYQTLSTMLASIANLLASSRALVSALVADEAETPTSTAVDEAAEEAIEDARLSSICALVAQMIGGLEGVERLSSDLIADAADNPHVMLPMYPGMTMSLERSESVHTKRGRVISSANETKLKTAKAHAMQCADHLETVLSQIETMAEPGPDVVDVTDIGGGVIREVEMDASTFFIIDKDDDEGVSSAEASAAITAAIRDVVSGLVQEQTQIALLQLRGRVD